jgi:hypothetical protein
MIDYLKDRIDFKVFGISYIVCTLLLISMIHYCNTGQTDSAFEEIAEDIIEYQLGVEIDFSPETGFLP